MTQFQKTRISLCKLCSVVIGLGWVALVVCIVSCVYWVWKTINVVDHSVKNFYLSWQWKIWDIWQIGLSACPSENSSRHQDHFLYRFSCESFLDIFIFLTLACRFEWTPSRLASRHRVQREPSLASPCSRWSPTCPCPRNTQPAIGVTWSFFASTQMTMKIEVAQCQK